MLYEGFIDMRGASLGPLLGYAPVPGASAKIRPAAEASSAVARTAACHSPVLFHPAFQPAGDRALGPRGGFLPGAEVLCRIRAGGQAAALDSVSRVRDSLSGGAAHRRMVSVALAVFSDRDYTA